LVNGKTLVFQFNSNNNTITDKQTRSKWNFEGKSIKVQLKGEQLLSLLFDEGFWFEWAAFHPVTKIYSQYLDHIRTTEIVGIESFGFIWGNDGFELIIYISEKYLIPIIWLQLTSMLFAVANVVEI
jgi:hypothetical protein